MWSKDDIHDLLTRLAAGKCDVDAAMRDLCAMPYEDLGCAKVDHHRSLRQGFPEVVYCEPKTPEQVAQIVCHLASRHDRVLGTRATRAQYEAAREHVPDLCYDGPSRAVWLDRHPHAPRRDGVVLLAAGTGDLPVAEEAALTLRLMGHEPRRIYDVGVAGMHRLLAHVPLVQSAHVIVVVAGMEGALPSVVAGMVSVPLIAVPTSVGYGASFGGLAPLLGMLNCCAAGVAVVNIDNGYGAGHLAARINDLAHGLPGRDRPREAETEAVAPGASRADA